MSHRNSLAYPRDEIAWYREQVRRDGRGSWLYYGPLLVATLLWWAVTRVVGVPWAVLRALGRRLRR